MPCFFTCLCTAVKYKTWYTDPTTRVIYSTQVNYCSLSAYLQPMIVLLTFLWPCVLGVKPLIHQSELGTYTKVVPFQEKVPFTL